MLQTVPLLSRDLVLTSRLHIEDSRRLMRAVLDRNVHGGRVRAARAEAHISRSITLLLEAGNRCAGLPSSLS